MNIEINNLSFNYPGRLILDNLSLKINGGKISAIIGPSGCGKTTLFNLLTGMLKPGKGEIIIPDKQEPAISYMTQHDLLLPWRNVLENVTLNQELGKDKKVCALVKEKALFLIDRVGLKEFSQHYPHQLSGGMRQRASLARALLSNSSLLLLDEPFGSLDLITREKIYELILELQKNQQLTVLFITHDFRDALTLSDKVFLMDKGCIQNSWNIDKDKSDLQSIEQEIRANLYAFSN